MFAEIWQVGLKVRTVEKMQQLVTFSFEVGSENENVLGVWHDIYAKNCLSFWAGFLSRSQISLIFFLSFFVTNQSR